MPVSSPKDKTAKESFPKEYRYTWSPERNTVPTDTVEGVLIDILGWVEGEQTSKGLQRIEKELEIPECKEKVESTLACVVNALHRLIIGRYLDELKILLTNVYVQLVVQGKLFCKTKFPALLYAVQRKFPQGVELLLKYGASQYIMAEKRTAIMQAVVFRNMQCLKLLLEDKEGWALVNYQDDEGVTALMVAAHAGMLDMVRYLIAHGANISLKTYSGKTAETFAKERKHQGCHLFLVQQRQMRQIRMDRLGIVESLPNKIIKIPNSKRSQTPDPKMMLTFV